MACVASLSTFGPAKNHLPPYSIFAELPTDGVYPAKYFLGNLPEKTSVKCLVTTVKKSLVDRAPLS